MFDEELFLSLCRKYDVEMSDQYNEPMLQIDDSVVEITKDVIKNEVFNFINNAKPLKVIFLDVDGELTYSNYHNEKTAHIDVEKVKLLKEICDKTGAKVVITSSWRGWEDYTPRIYHVLIDILESYDIEILGDAPYIHSEYETDNNGIIVKNPGSSDIIPSYKLKYGTGRAAEVQKWINEHNVESFVILDDEDYDWADYGYEKNWIQPTWYGDGGLKAEHVAQAIRILNKEL